MNERRLTLTAASGFPNTNSSVFIDPKHPIKQIDIRSGWAIDSITTTYRMTDGSLKTIRLRIKRV